VVIATVIGLHGAGSTTRSQVIGGSEAALIGVAAVAAFIFVKELVTIPAQLWAADNPNFPRSLISIKPQMYLDTAPHSRVLFFDVSATNQQTDQRMALELTLRLYTAFREKDGWGDWGSHGSKMYVKAIGHPNALSQPIALGPGEFRDGSLVVGSGLEDMYLAFDAHGEDYGTFQLRTDRAVRGRFELDVFDRVSGATAQYPVEFEENE